MSALVPRPDDAVKVLTGTERRGGGGRREDIADMVARAVAEEEFADDRSREMFEQDTFDKLLKEVQPCTHQNLCDASMATDLTHADSGV